MTINLASTIHDPQAGMKWMSDKFLTQLKELYSGIYLTSSPYTDQDYLNDLGQAGVEVKKRGDNKIGRTYFDSINRANTEESDYVFYCDFDRILHWIKDYPEELEKLINQLKSQDKKSKVDYIVAQRTEKGYKEHQESLYLTEQLPNKVISDKMGLDEQKDFLAGCFIYSKRSADIIVNQGGYDDLAFFGAWPLLLQNKGVNIEYKEFRGLSWETPDWNRKEVEQKGGIDEFRESLNSREEWKKRTKMANEFVEGIINKQI
jgi:hypothetical protein